MYNDNSNPVISDCTSDSAVAEKGGFMANYNNSNPVITKCIFKNSDAANGGVCYNNHANTAFYRCSFINTGVTGGVFYNENTTVKVEGCVGYGYNNNLVYSSNGTGRASFMYNSASIADVINTTIVKNDSASQVFFNTNGSTLNLKNSILWHNNFNLSGDIYYSNIPNTYNTEIYNDGSVTNISNTITRVYGTNGVNGNMLAVDPRFININNPAGADGIYGTSDDGLQLCTCSPAINSGANTGISNAIDIAGNSRIFNGITDMGAYEYQSTLVNNAKTIFVNAAAIGTKDGYSWQNAYPDLHNAINNPCADTIKIAAGIYKPAQSNRDSSFTITRRLYLAGGYQNISNPSETTRNADDYPTIISGDIGVTNDSTDNSYTVLSIRNTDSTVQVDGLTFTGIFHDHKSGLTVLPVVAFTPIIIKTCSLKIAGFTTIIPSILLVLPRCIHLIIRCG